MLNEKKRIEDINEEYYFDNIKHEFDEEYVLSSLEVFCVGENENF